MRFWIILILSISTKNAFSQNSTTSAGILNTDKLTCDSSNKKNNSDSLHSDDVVYVVKSPKWMATPLFKAAELTEAEFDRNVKVDLNISSSILNMEIVSNDVKEIFIAGYQGNTLNQFSTAKGDKIKVDMKAYGDGLYFLKYIKDGKSILSRLFLERPIGR